MIVFAAVHHVLADAAGISANQFVAWGFGGVLALLLMTGQLVPGWLYKRSEAENDRLRKLIDDKVYPTIEASTRTTQEAVEALREARRRRSSS